MRLSDDIKEKLFDSRMIERMSRKGEPLPQGYTKHIETLADDSEMADQVQLDDPSASR